MKGRTFCLETHGTSESDRVRFRSELLGTYVCH